MPPKALLDTDILSAVMRQQPEAVAQAKPYLAAHGQLTTVRDKQLFLASMRAGTVL